MDVLGLCRPPRQALPYKRIGPSSPPCAGVVCLGYRDSQRTGPILPKAKEVTDRLSLSVFAIEVDGKPILTFEANPVPRHS